MHDTPQEQPPRSLLKWKGVDQDGQSWVAIAIRLSHTHARTLYTHARTHALTLRTHMNACMHAHTHTPTHASTLTSPALRQVQTAVSKATTHGRLPAALGSWSCIHVPTCRIRCAEVCAEAGNWGCKRAVKLTPRDRSACACGVHAWSEVHRSTLPPGFKMKGTERAQTSKNKLFLKPGAWPGVKLLQYTSTSLGPQHEPPTTKAHQGHSERHGPATHRASG